MLIDFAYCYFLHRIVECKEKDCIIEAGSLLFYIGDGRFTPAGARLIMASKAVVFRHKLFPTKKRRWLRNGNLIYCLKQEGYNSGHPIMVNDITVKVEDSEQNKSRVEEIAILLQNTLNKQ